jgi:hypothetical protein
LSVNIKSICTSFRNRQNSEPSASFSGLFRSEYKWILYLTTMYVFFVYPAMSKMSEILSDLDKKDRNKRHSSPFINVVKSVFFVFRVTLVPVSYLSAPSVVHSYRVPESLFVGWKVYSSSTNKAKLYSYSIFVQQMYWLQDKLYYWFIYRYMLVWEVIQGILLFVMRMTVFFYVVDFCCRCLSVLPVQCWSFLSTL